MTSTRPNVLCTSRLSARAIEAGLQRAGPERERQAQRKIDRGDERVGEQWLERRRAHHLACARELDEAEDGGERGALDELHQEADGRRQRQPQRLRRDDVAKLLPGGEAEAGAGLPLRL